MPYKKYSIADDAYGRLSSSVSTTLTTIPLSSSQNLTAGNWIGTLVQYGLDGYPTKKEKVYVTTNNSGILSVTRGYDGSPAQAFNEGDYIFMNVVVEVFRDMQEEITRLNTAKPDASNVYTKTEVDGKFTSLLNGAGPALDTLKEIQDALGNDANFASTITNALAGKANDSAVVHIAGTEAITGNKTFNNQVILTNASSIVLNNAPTNQVTQWEILSGYTSATDGVFNIYDRINSRAVLSALRTNGYIGIGTTNPTAPLDVSNFPGNQGVQGKIGRTNFIDEGAGGLPGGMSSEGAGFGLGLYSPSGPFQIFAGGKTMGERRFWIGINGVLNFAEQTVQPFYGPQHMLYSDAGFSYKWKSAANSMILEAAPSFVGINKQLFRNYDSGGSANTLKIASRYELSGITHGNQGHIVQFIWGDLNGSPEGTGIDGGWGVEFGAHGRPYLKMMGNETQVQNLRLMKTIDISGQNLNSYSDGGGGFFSGVNMTNAPTADWYIVEVIVHAIESASVAYLVQRATRITGAGVGTVFSRVKSNTTWTSWTQLN